MSLSYPPKIYPVEYFMLKTSEPQVSSITVNGLTFPLGTGRCKKILQEESRADATIEAYKSGYRKYMKPHEIAEAERLLCISKPTPVSTPHPTLPVLPVPPTPTETPIDVGGRSCTHAFVLVIQDTPGAGPCIFLVRNKSSGKFCMIGGKTLDTDSAKFGNVASRILFAQSRGLIKVTSATFDSYPISSFVHARPNVIAPVRLGTPIRVSAWSGADTSVANDPDIDDFRIFRVDSIVADSSKLHDVTGDEVEIDRLTQLYLKKFVTP